MRRLLSLLSLCAVEGCSTAPPKPPLPQINISAEVVGEECRLKVEGRLMTIDELTAAARAWRGRRVHLDMDVNTPYKCIGAAVFALQRARVKRIGFISEPPPVPEEK